MTIDSNIVIAFLEGEQKVIDHLSAWKEAGLPLFLPTIAEAEVLGYPKYSEGERQRIALFLRDNFVPVLCDRAIAYRAAVLRGTVPSIKLPDAIIASTALLVATPLVTRNVADFKKVPGLEIVSL